MQHQDVDASLRAAEPALQTLQDGFSPPAVAPAAPQEDSGATQPPEPSLGTKSPF